MKVSCKYGSKFLSCIDVKNKIQESMKRLKKIRLSEAMDVLTDQEMKFVKGGDMFACKRCKIASSGSSVDCDTFFTDSSTLAVAWMDAWNAHHDWRAECNGYHYNSNLY